MGNNAAYTVWEEQVMSVYEQGKLTLETLDALCEPYRGMDIDSGGSRRLESHDGKGVVQICVELVKPGFVPNYGDNPAHYWTWYDEFSEISYDRWGWR